MCVEELDAIGAEIDSPRLVPSKRKIDESDDAPAMIRMCKHAISSSADLTLPTVASVPQHPAVSLVPLGKPADEAVECEGEAASSAPSHQVDDSVDERAEPESQACGMSGGGDGGIEGNPWRPDGTVQFFVSTGAGSRVFRASREDTVMDLHRRIEEAMGIPVPDQRLLYRGRQLQEEWTLAGCGVQKDACLQLAGRMRSTDFPQSWAVANNLVSSICSIGNTRPLRYSPQTLVEVFLKMTPKEDDKMLGHFQVFLMSGAPRALIMLYASQVSQPRSRFSLFAEKAVQLFLNSDPDLLSKHAEAFCAPILFEFCKILSTAVPKHDHLYLGCRRKLGLLLEPSGITSDSRYFIHPRPISVVKELLPYVEELGGILSEKLLNLLTVKLLPDGVSVIFDVLIEFSNFMVPFRRSMLELMRGFALVSMPHHEVGETVVDGVWPPQLHCLFLDLLDKVDQCLKMVEEFIVKEGQLSDVQCMAWCLFLAVLTELNGILEIFEPHGKLLHAMLLNRRVPINALLSRAKRNTSFQWFLKYKDIMNFEARKNLVMMMFPEEKEDYEEMLEMLIDRSNLLPESFGYINQADRSSLQGGLFMEFKNEEATGPGVLREWFCLVCQAIFNPQNVLFIPCPNDQRRFFPNPKSVVDPLHLDYFGFCGRVIALALMHKVQIGVAFDRVFFLQLADKHITLEDIQYADPLLYASCKKILEMDVDILDSNALELTFVREVEELGMRRDVELCKGGGDIVVNSKNRRKYVDLLIHHHFVTSVSQQVARFAQGFADILCNSSSQKLFFQSLELEDLDRLLGGSEKGICLKDWKDHTEYKGFRKKDRQVKWFWKVVEELSADQRRVLLIFWTSVRYLPLDGFGGLPSKLYIYRTAETPDHLPTSHTCFYQLCIPTYPSLSVMRDRLRLVTQEHVGCSFGTW